QMQCPMESGIVAGAAAGTLSAAQRTHAASCPVCAGSISISSVMTDIALAFRAEKHLSIDPKMLWYRAQFGKRRERISLLDMISLWMMSFAGVCATLVLVWINYPALSTMVSSTGMTLFPGTI